MLRTEKYSYKEFDNEKNSRGSKIPLPPHNFSNGPSLKAPTTTVICYRLLFAKFQSGR